MEEKLCWEDKSIAYYCITLMAAIFTESHRYIYPSSLCKIPKMLPQLPTVNMQLNRLTQLQQETTQHLRDPISPFQYFWVMGLPLQQSGCGLSGAGSLRSNNKFTYLQIIDSSYISPHTTQWSGITMWRRHQIKSNPIILQILTGSPPCARSTFFIFLDLGVFIINQIQLFLRFQKQHTSNV